MASKEILEEIRQRLSIVTVVGERVPLKKSGRNFKGLCPFHQEKTPSFMVSEEKQIFHCFGCSEGGDIFSFLMKMDGLTFPEALKDLAQQAGVKLPQYTSPRSKAADQAYAKKKAWGYRLNETAKEIFCRILNDPEMGEKGRNYLHSRGIDTKTAGELSLGLAGASWEGLAQAFQKAKVPLDFAVELGLIKKREQKGGYFDFFRNRLLFPILDLKNNVVGFGGRTLGDGETAKYLNSPESFLYHKSSILYGLNASKEFIRKREEAIIVEGYMDWIALWKEGITNVVAPCGTALTTDQIKLLTRYTRNISLAFDGDQAGIEAALRTLPLFLDLGLTPRAIVLPPGQDPDDFLKSDGKEAFEKRKLQGPTLFEFYIDGVIAKSPPGTAGSLQAWKKIEMLLKKVQNRVERGIYLKRVSEKTQIEEKELNIALKTLKNNSNMVKNEVKMAQYPEEERLLIAAMVIKSHLARKIREAGDIFQHEELKEISTQLFQKIDDEGNIGINEALGACNKQLAAWIREMALVDEEDAIWGKAVQDCLAKIRKRNLGSRLLALNQKIAEAEKEGNETDLVHLLSEKAKLMETKKERSL